MRAVRGHLQMLARIGCLDPATLGRLARDPPAVEGVRETIGQMGRDCPELVLSHLRADLLSESWADAADAARGLGHLGSAAAEAVPDLCAGLTEGSAGFMEEDAARHVRLNAAWALGRIQVHDEDVVLALRHAIDGPDRQVKRRAQLALAATRPRTWIAG